MHRSAAQDLGLSAFAVAAALAVLVGAAFSGNASPSRPVAPRPTTVAVVDLTAVMEQLAEFKDRNTEFGRRGDIIRAELQALDDKITQAQNELKNTIDKSDTKRQIDKLREIEENRIILKARQEAHKAVVELEQGEFVHSLYAKSIEAVKALAEKEGIDLVIADDRAIMTRPEAPIGENRRRMDARGIIFAAPHLSLTDRLVTIMNNDYSAGRATPAPAQGRP
ncbi:MAG: OmpH family outer membrane protein [Planctomycetota bacterium]|nr:OmpH family outer membrane protein [Planctomycetota bacterium]